VRREVEVGGLENHADRVEDDVDYGGDGLHGRGGPVPLTRVLDPHLKPSVSWGQPTDDIFAGSHAFVLGKTHSVPGIQVLNRLVQSGRPVWRALSNQTRLPLEELA